MTTRRTPTTTAVQLAHAPRTNATVNLTYNGTPVQVHLADASLTDIEHLIHTAHTRNGWTNTSGAVPAQAAASRTSRRTPKGLPLSTPTQIIPTRPRLSLPMWLDKVNNHPNEAPHMSIFGPSGSGKTTLAHALMATRRGQFVVIDPKPALPGTAKWCGVPYVMIDDDGGYTAIEAQLQAIRMEVNRRLAAMKRGEAAYTPLTIVLDEYKTLRRVCPESASDVFITLSDIGRELGMRLVILSTSRGVESLGIKGMGDTKDSHIIIEVDKQHRATLEWDGVTYDLDTPQVHTALPSIPPMNWWNPTTIEETTLTLTLETRTRRVRA